VGKKLGKGKDACVLGRGCALHIAQITRHPLPHLKQILAHGRAPATLPDPALLQPDPAGATTTTASPPTSPRTGGKKGGKKKGAAAGAGGGGGAGGEAAYLVRSVEPLVGAARAVRREGAETEAWAPRLQVCAWLSIACLSEGRVVKPP
jgi:hypothetical protein